MGIAKWAAHSYSTATFSNPHKPKRDELKLLTFRAVFGTMALSITSSSNFFRLISLVERRTGVRSADDEPAGEILKSTKDRDRNS